MSSADIECSGDSFGPGHPNVPRRVVTPPSPPSLRVLGGVLLITALAVLGCAAFTPVTFYVQEVRWIMGIEEAIDPSQSPKTMEYRIVAANNTLQVEFDLQIVGQMTLTPSANSTAIISDLSRNGFVAFRVPHIPPTNTVGTVANVLVDFTYRETLTSPLIRHPITLVRRSSYDALIASQYPITDERSHWEAWWLPPGGQLPWPDTPFVRPRLIVRITLAYLDAGFAPCWGCPFASLVSNGREFLGPFPTILAEPFTGGVPSGQALAKFESCGFAYPRTAIVEYVPAAPFSITHCLKNYDNLTQTFQIQTSSTLGWDYAISIEKLDSLEGRRSLTNGLATIDGQLGLFSRLLIVAIYTPTATVNDTLRDHFAITATSTLSPSVRARADTVVLSVTYPITSGTPFTPAADSRSPASRSVVRHRSAL